MKAIEESRIGWAYSLIGPFLVSLVVAILTGLEKGFMAFFGSYTIFLIASLMFTAVLSGVIGIPMYLILKKINLVNPIVITAMGFIVALAIALKDSTNIYLSGLYLAYGGVSAFLFWYGSTKKIP